MVDHLTKEKRSWNMSRIRSNNTKPEQIVRSLLYAMGYRFRLQGKVSKKLHPKGILPGKPDIVIPKLKTAIFVHGCFWHRHEGCKGATTPKTRTDWWLAKFAKNIERDKQKQCELRKLGWNVITIWECEVKNQTNLEAILKSKLENQYSLQEETQPYLIAAEEQELYSHKKT